MKPALLLVGLSLSANAVLGYLLWHREPPPPALVALPIASPAETAKLQLGADGFDFSNTTLSDEAWKLEKPTLEPPPP